MWWESIVSKKNKRMENVFRFDYQSIGTVSIKEFGDAFMEDIHALEDLYNIHFVTGSRLYLPVTNEYGDPMRVIHPDGRRVDRIDTHHYRPACLDYDM